MNADSIDVAQLEAVFGSPVIEGWLHRKEERDTEDDTTRTALGVSMQHDDDLGKESRNGLG